MKYAVTLLTIFVACHSPSQSEVTPASLSPIPLILNPDSFRHYIEEFNLQDPALYVQAVPNEHAWEFLKANVPLFDCPDKGIEETYYFRWWTFRKAIKHTPEGFIITEFLPNVEWAGKYNSISCAAGHHFYEGRWIADPRYLDDYSRFWFKSGSEPRRYSFWVANSIWARAQVTGDDNVGRELLPDLIRNYSAWEDTHRDENGLFWQMDDRDGMEMSISGTLHPEHLGYRVTINSYMFGDALAISALADRAGNKALAKQFSAKAAEIKRLTQEKLWDQQAQFFKVAPRGDEKNLSDARELHGYTPWYFNLPDADKSIAWKQVVDRDGFNAPFGLTTAEQRHPQFSISYQGHECQWNGPSWPFATAITLTGLANLLNNYDQAVLDKGTYFSLLKTYADSHRLKLESGALVPWIDENLNPFTGDWISRTRLKTWNNGTWDPSKGGRERGKDYNHSTFCDLIISGLVGLRPRIDDNIEVNPLVPEGIWDYFCLDQIRYHGHWLTVVYDKNGERYGRGKGFRVYCDGQEAATAETLGRLRGKLCDRMTTTQAGSGPPSSASPKSESPRP